MGITLLPPVMSCGSKHVPFAWSCDSCGAQWSTMHVADGIGNPPVSLGFRDVTEFLDLVRVE